MIFFLILVVIFFLVPPLKVRNGESGDYLSKESDSWINKGKKYYAVACIAVLLLFIIAWLMQRMHHLFYPMYDVAFVLLLIMMIMRLDFKAPLLVVVGKHVFSIYILQRLVFSIGEFLDFNNNAYLFLCITFIVTLLISIIYDKIFAFTESHLINRKSTKKEGGIVKE